MRETETEKTAGLAVLHKSFTVAVATHIAKPAFAFSRITGIEDYASVRGRHARIAIPEKITHIGKQAGKKEDAQKV
jgi:hypothetical protein